MKIEISNNQIIIGELYSIKIFNKEELENLVSKIMKTNLRPSIRKGSNEQWFGILEDNDSRVILSSRDLNSQKDAIDASYKAAQIIRNIREENK